MVFSPIQQRLRWSSPTPYHLMWPKSVSFSVWSHIIAGLHKDFPTLLLHDTICWKRKCLFIGLLSVKLPFISLRSCWFPLQCLPTPNSGQITSLFWRQVLLKLAWVLYYLEDGSVHSPHCLCLLVSQSPWENGTWSGVGCSIYMLGHHGAVFADYSACLSLLNTVHPSGKLARRALTIQEIDLSIALASPTQMLMLFRVIHHCPLLPKSSSCSKYLCWSRCVFREQYSGPSNIQWAEIYQL